MFTIKIGSFDILGGGYLRLAQELRDVADQLAALSAHNPRRGGNAVKKVKH